MRKLTALLMLLASSTVAETTNFEIDGNLAPTRNPGCVALRDARSDLSPPDIALGIRQCIIDQEWRKAADLLYLMNIRGRFDSLRVVDKTAHQAFQVLNLQLGQSLWKPQQDALMPLVDQLTSKGTPARNAFCAEMRRQGPPVHDPTWMINHGMGAFTGIEGDGLVPGFNALRAWNDILNNEIECPL